MKKMKKVLAVLLTLAMVMGMSLTTFAATKDSATITVSNAENAILQYVQVIEPDVDSATGWKFSESTGDAIKAAYLAALGTEDAQTAIAMLIKYEYGDTVPETAPAKIKNATPATAAQINTALENVMNNVTFNAMNNPQDVTVAGVYAISASETGYAYKPMAAYVGFGTVTEKVESEVEGEFNEVTYGYPSLTDAELNAKKVPTTLTKADNDPDNAVSIGQTVTYTVTTTFPYFAAHEVERYFAISDTITGAEYVGLVEDTTTDVNEKTATVKIGDDFVDAEFVEAEDGGSFRVDLSAYTDNTYANQTVVVTYQAIMTETTIQNSATSHIGDDDVDSNIIKLYTGKITLVKTDAEDSSVKLEDAGFVVSDANGGVLTFVQKNEAVKVYTYDPTGEITEVFTDANGEVVVEGLDIGTYTFTERTAPKGYSINETPVTATLVVGEKNTENEAIAIFVANTSIADTKLLALPSTGGIGTTIFTVAGCMIMIAAAAMFIVSRRKEAK